ncbi:DUF4398 domain-containing protein [Undibacterium jejuense]|uniref:DUF4398 domain-containing protein n=1 Tax=Undibacterium jejuense TaxID=1344949 RepID=A0A923HM06_9BURK|nr:DUF4398 domain-containing protein [Undibacterium jejuense]MBC3863359.1 DUF4398 domain-containing protein [Undibacterium jejuense]
MLTAHPQASNLLRLIFASSFFAYIFTISACSNLQTPATADVAVSTSAVNGAAAVGGGEYAPAEMRSAREKLAQANTAMAAHDYQAASDYAAQAQADAKLAQTKVSSTKAQQAATALQEDIRVLREELNRVNNK